MLKSDFNSKGFLFEEFLLFWEKDLGRIGKGLKLFSLNEIKKKLVKVLMGLVIKEGLGFEI